MIAYRYGKKANTTTGKKALALLVSLLLAAMLAMTGCASNASSDASSSQSSSSQSSSQAAQAAQDMDVTLVVLDPADESLKALEEEISVEGGATVYDALLASTADADIQDSEYGKYVVGLAGKAAEGNGGWVYTVNGEEVMDSIDAHELADGDVVEFKYITM